MDHQLSKDQHRPLVAIRVELAIVGARRISLDVVDIRGQWFAPRSLLLGGNGRCHVFGRGLDWCGNPVKKVECGAIVVRRPVTE